MQPWPACAQAEAERTWQMLPAQQLFGQLVASQTQTLPEHRWPAAHEAPVAPQTQTPEALQESDRVTSHATHAVPDAPQVGKAGLWH